MNFRKQVLLLILLSTVTRCSIALFLEFGNDEVYYWTYAIHLQWNYFDHPPIIALLIRLTTLNFHFQNEFFVRLGPILCAAANTWLIYLLGNKIKDEKTGWYAALLYSSSFYCSIIAGTFILPDSPQVLFWVLAIYLMTEIIEENHSLKKQNLLLIFLGIVIGLCIMSKVHGIFLWFGFGLYILFFDKKLLRSPYLYLSILLTLIIISPIFFWNLQNHFITCSFHNGRVGFWGKHIDTDSFLQQIFGSIFYNNPVNYILYIITFIAIVRKRTGIPVIYIRLYLLLGLPLIIVLLIMSLFNETLPHWSGPAYVSILLLTAAYFSSLNPGSSKIPQGIRIAVILFLVIVLAGIPAIRSLPVQLGSKEERILGKGDVMLDMNGWEKFSTEFDSLYQSDISNGRMKPHAFIVSDDWFPAAHLDYYLARPLGMKMMAIGKLRDIHHYAWLNQKRPPIEPGSDAYFIYPSNYYGPPQAQLRTHFGHVEDSLVLVQKRSGVPVRNFIIYRMHDYLGNIGRDGVLENSK